MDFMKTEKILEEFEDLKLHGERPETFVEIAGHPRRELVFSNILAYFLDPDKPHGLGSLVLQTFCELAMESEAGGFRNVEIEVERETRTGAGKFIDILVQTEKFVLLIENKIDARINNPFDEYASHLEEIAEDRERIKVLLTVSGSNAGKLEGFVNLTYSRFVAGLELNLGKRVSQADTRLLTFFLDFLNTLDNLKRGTRMDSELIEFLARNQDEVQELLYKVTELNKEMRSKTKELRRALGKPEYANVTQHLHESEDDICESLAHDIRLSEDFVIRVDTTIYPRGWDIWIWPHTGDGEGLEDLSRLRSTLKKSKIPVEELHEDWGFLHELSYWSKSEPFKETGFLGYGTEISEVAEVVQDLIDKLCSKSAKF